MMSQVIEVVERYILPDLPDSSQLPEEDGVPLETNANKAEAELEQLRAELARLRGEEK
jgi:hypothetical protein